MMTTKEQQLLANLATLAHKYGIDGQLEAMCSLEDERNPNPGRFDDGVMYEQSSDCPWNRNQTNELVRQPDDWDRCGEPDDWERREDEKWQAADYAWDDYRIEQAERRAARRGVR